MALAVCHAPHFDGLVPRPSDELPRIRQVELEAGDDIAAIFSNIDDKCQFPCKLSTPLREVWVSLRACPRARIAMRIWHHALRLPVRSVVHVQSHVFAHTPKIVHQRRRDRAQNQQERGTRDAHALVCLLYIFGEY